MENAASDSADTGIFTADVKQETNGQDVSEMVNIKVQERDGFNIEVTLDRNKTVQELKEKLEAELGEQRRCLARNMRLTVAGQSLDQDGIKLDDIPELGENQQIIQLVRVQDTTMNESAQPRPNAESVNMSNAVRARLNNCRILQRNFEACVDAAQTSKVLFEVFKNIFERIQLIVSDSMKPRRQRHHLLLPVILAIWCVIWQIHFEHGLSSFIVYRIS